MARRRIVPVPVPARGPGTSATDQPGPATATVVDLPMPIIRPYIGPYSPEFRHEAVLLTRSTSVPMTHVARELGISSDRLRDWIAQARHDPCQLHEGTLCETGQAELVRHRRQRGHHQRTGQAVTVTPVTGDQADFPTALRFAVVARLASRWPVATLCQGMGVSRSGYYAWKDRLRRLRRLRGRQPAPGGHGRVVHGIRTGDGWLHRAVVIDLRLLQLVGSEASATLDASLTGNAVRMALHRRRPARGRERVHHSDLGSTYTAWAFRALLRPAGITGSMGRPGTCLDNAVAETFCATLKVELIHRRPWPSRADVVQAIFASVETWYTPHRRHRSLGYLSPVAFEASQPSAPSAPKPLTVR